MHDARALRPATYLAQLLERVSSGDTDAFGRFYDATAQMVFSMALKSVSDRQRAEAITRQIYVAAWTSAPDFEASCIPATVWLRLIAVRMLAGLPQRDASRLSSA